MAARVKLRYRSDKYELSFIEKCDTVGYFLCAIRDVVSDDHLRQSELALHFENGREFESAARYLILSAENAARRYAHLDSIATLEHALTKVKRAV